MVTEGFAKTPEPPYYAATFTSLRTEGDIGYEITAAAMLALALEQPGCLGQTQRSGTERWYSHYEVRAAKVDRAYSGPEGR